MRLLSVILVMLLVISMSACHAVPFDTVTDVGPDLNNPQKTEPSAVETIPTTVPTEPTMPKELVSEAREDGLLYTPYCSNYWSGIMIALNFALDESLYPGMEITFEGTINAGYLYRAIYADPHNPTVYEHHGQYTTKNNFGFLWRYAFEKGMQEIWDAGGTVFVDAIIRADGHIVGYGIFEIAGQDAKWFALMRAETVIFPMFNGQLQEVSEEYVVEKIAELKQTVTPFDLEAKQAEYNAYRGWN